MLGWFERKKPRREGEQPSPPAQAPEELVRAESQTQTAVQARDVNTEPADAPSEPEVAELLSATTGARLEQDIGHAGMTGPPPTRLQPANGLLARLRAGLAKTGRSLTDGVGNLFLGKKTIDAELMEELETRLLMADVGVEATTCIIDDLTARIRRKQLGDADALFAALKEDMRGILAPVGYPLAISATKRPFVILMVGINGAGKTTTVGKLAQRFRQQGYSVLLAAGDTFRAAAVEQLQVWGTRNGVDVIAQDSGADSAAVIFDAFQSAKARGIDILIADTAGRLHTQAHLMEELKKVKRVIARLDPDAPHEIMLVVDAGIGQNAINQAREFNAALGLTGISVTKLDGTAKGGIVFALAQQFGIPIRFIGIGEQARDLRVFNPGEFVDALLATDSKGQ